MQALLDVFIDEACELGGDPFLRSLRATAVNVLIDASRLDAGGVLLLGGRTTDGAPSLRALTELRRRNSHVIIYLCARWDRALVGQFTQYVRAGIDEAFTISTSHDVMDLVHVVTRRVLAPPPVAALKAIADIGLEGRPRRFVLHAFRNSQFAVHMEDVARRWGYRLRTIESFLEKVPMACARDLYRCGRYSHHDELSLRGVVSVTERAARLGFDTAMNFRKWKWRLKESARTDTRLREFAEHIPELAQLVGRDEYAE